MQMRSGGVEDGRNKAALRGTCQIWRQLLVSPGTIRVRRFWLAAKMRHKAPIMIRSITASTTLHRINNSHLVGRFPCSYLSLLHSC